MIYTTLCRSKSYQRYGKYLSGVMLSTFLFQDFIAEHYSEEGDKYDDQLEKFETMRKVGPF